jgi:DNA-binding transcriptional LysR family regulator
VGHGQTSDLREQPVGPVRVHCFRSAVELYVRPILRPFAEMYPDVVLDITLDDEVVDVVTGRYDAAIRIGEVIEKDMVAIRLGPDLRQIAVASPDYLARRGEPNIPGTCCHINVSAGAGRDTSSPTNGSSWKTGCNVDSVIRKRDPLPRLCRTILSR